METTMHSALQAAGVAVAKTQTQKSAPRGYRRADVPITAHLVMPEDYRSAKESPTGNQEGIWLQHPACPEHRSLVQGQHFEYVPPFKGRDKGRVVACRDTTQCGLFVPLIPLLIVARGAWKTPPGQRGLRGVMSIGHFRPARVREDAAGNMAVDHSVGFGIARELRSYDPEILLSDFRMALGCRDGGHTEQLIPGGPLEAVVYENETVIPGYRDYEEGKRDHLPFGYVVERRLLEMIRHSFCRGAKAAADIRQGKTPQVAYAVSGVRRAVAIGPVTIELDRVGRVHAIRETLPTGATVAKTHRLFENRAAGLKLTVRRGQVVVDPVGRQVLGLDEPTITVTQPVSPVVVQTPPAATAEISTPLEEGWEELATAMLDRISGPMPRIEAADGKVVVMRGTTATLPVLRAVVDRWSQDAVRQTPEAGDFLQDLNALHVAMGSEEETGAAAPEAAAPVTVIAQPAPEAWVQPAQEQRRAFTDLPQVVKAAAIQDLGLTEDQQVCVEMALGQLPDEPLPRILSRSTGHVLVEAGDRLNAHNLGAVIRALEADDVVAEAAMADWFRKFLNVYETLNPEPAAAGGRVVYAE